MKLHKKRRHHYVWRHYLKSWASDEKIWCFREGKIFNSNLMGVAQERDFYKIEKLTDIEVELVRRLITIPNSPADNELNHGWLDMMQFGFKIKEAFDSRYKSEEVSRLISTKLHNYEEDYFAKIEADFGKYIDLLLSRDTSFYHDPDKSIEFLYFLTLQYFRTKNLQQNIFSTVTTIAPETLKKIWPILRHVFATQTAKSIYVNREKYRLVLLINQTRAPLLTSDQPIINTHAVNLPLNTEVTKLEFYYPISSNLAILISADMKFSDLKKYYLNYDDVERFNRAMINSAYRQVFSSDRESLDYFCNSSNVGK